MEKVNQEHRILVVDDDQASLQVLKRILQLAGYAKVESTTDARRVLSIFKAFDPDIVLLDLHMPHIDGFAIMKMIQSRIPDESYLPFLVITGDERAKQQALAGGARDFLTKPYEVVEVVLRVRNLLETRDLYHRLEEKVRERTEDLRIAEVEVAERLALVAEFRDYGDGAHTQRVGHLSAQIAEVLDMTAEEVKLLRRAAPLHDIGKLAIPDGILLKDGPLTPGDFAVLKTHTTIGMKMLSGSSSKILQLAEEIALYHHENWDGTGYTPGLAGETIPLSARIVTVADVFDALIHRRPYKQAWRIDDAVLWIRGRSGTKFEPRIVDAFLRIQADGKLAVSQDDAPGNWPGLADPAPAAAAEMAATQETPVVAS